MENDSVGPLSQFGRRHDDEYFGDIERFETKDRIKNENLSCLANIVGKVLKPDGVALFSENWSGPHMIDLFQALRDMDILPDWRYSHNRGEFDESGHYQLTNGILAFSRGPKTLTQSPIEDHLAFWSMGDLAVRNREFSRGTTLQLARIFETTNPLLELDLTYHSGGTHRLKITRRESCLFVTSISTLGYEKCLIYSVGEIQALFNNDNLKFLERAKDNSVCHIANLIFDHLFKDVLEFHDIKLELSKPDNDIHNKKANNKKSK